jgi:hypothetical protein
MFFTWKSKACTSRVHNGICLSCRAQKNHTARSRPRTYTDKKEGRKSFLIYEEMYKYFPIYEEAVSHI